jgi:glycerol-3-phosphate dehydrogenase
MKRDLAELSNKRFDVLVVGGGIYGAIAAWDATLRGLSVALIEKGDFGGASSQNSLKVIHGGLRYLQDGNIMRVRTMSKERTTWMKIAPHLVHPLACLTPTYSKLSRSRLAMQFALIINDLLSYDRNRLPDEEKKLPAGQIIAREECAQLLPQLDTSGITGAAIWHDAQMHNSERLLLSFVISASRAGAAVANYVEAIGFLRKDTSIFGVKAKDGLSGEEFEIQAKVIINSTGAWVDHLLEDMGSSDSRPHFATSVGLNLVTHQVWEKYAAGLPSRASRHTELNPSSRRSQMFFIVPWRNNSIIGTWHIPWAHAPDSFVVTEAVLNEFIEEVNSAHPGLALTMKDIHHVHYGFLPMINPRSSRVDEVRLLREGRVIDHQLEDGLTGLVSLVGVKYTTARVIAQYGVNLAIQKLKIKGSPCRTDEIPVSGGKIDRFNDFLSSALTSEPAGLKPEIIEHLVYTYGSEYDCIIEYVREQPTLGERVDEGSPVIKAEIVHAMRKEMAQTLTDLVQRRTELGAAGLPALSALQTCADLIGEELNWDSHRKARAIEEVRQSYPLTSQPG